MSKSLVSIIQLSETMGISVTTIRRRVAAGTLPYTRANTKAGGKLLFDEELVREVLRQESLNNLRNCNMGEDTPEPKAKPASYLASLLKEPEDPVEAKAERDKRFGYEPFNTNKSGSFTK